jgi:hypothetical protein
MRLGIAAALVGAVFVLSGCQSLFGLSAFPPPAPGSFDPGEFGSFDPGEGSFDPGPEFSLPPPLATYTKGTASVTVGGKTTKYDHLASPAKVYEDLGTEAAWTDGGGLYLHYYGMLEPGTPDEGAFVTLDRIIDGQHWSSADPTVCTIKLTQSDAKGLAGTATCKGVRWIDTMASFGGGLQPAYVEGQAAFDAQMTFQAAP